MDLSAIIAELRSERDRVAEAMRALEKLTLLDGSNPSGPKKKGTPQVWAQGAAAHSTETAYAIGSDASRPSDDDEEPPTP